ncbi:MAG: alpha/beta hydrolase [Natronomonas sp.]
MPRVTVDGATVRYETGGTPAEEAVVFLPEAGIGPWLWGWQTPALTGPHRTLVVALRGTDGSDADPPYTVDRLADDLEAILRDAAVRRAHLVGAGLGGAVALRYARRHNRARSLVLLGTPQTGEDVDTEALRRLCPPSDDRQQFQESLAVGFSSSFRSAATDQIRQIRTWRRAEDARGAARDGLLGSLLEFDAGALYEITLPTLLLYGLDDPVVPPTVGEAFACDLPNGRFTPVEGRRFHFVEHAAAVTDEIAEFLTESN